MNIADLEYLEQNLNTTDLQGSDSSLGNIFLLEKRYNIISRIESNTFFREYNYSDSITGFAFPLCLSNNQRYLEFFFTNIIKRNKKIQFCLFTQNQKNDFDNFLLNNHSDYKIEWKTNPDDYDYIYLQSDLANLPGQKYQKKRNHISQFYRNYPNSKMIFFDKSNFSEVIKHDFVFVVEKWISEQSNENYNSVFIDEKNSIMNALQYVSIFDFKGAILYSHENPIAVTLASKISSSTIDIHFEKCLKEPASYGGYAVINNEFAKKCSDYLYINREEDLGINGLKKAKLSYKPTLILTKYYGYLIKN